MKNAQGQLQNYFKSKSMDNLIGQKLQPKKKQDLQVLYIEKNASSSNKQDLNSRNTDEVFDQKPIKKQSIRSETLKYNRRKVEAPIQNSGSSDEIKLLDQIKNKKNSIVSCSKHGSQHNSNYRRPNKVAIKQFNLERSKIISQRIGQILNRMGLMESRISELQKQLHVLRKK